MAAGPARIVRPNTIVITGVWRKNPRGAGQNVAHIPVVESGNEGRETGVRRHIQIITRSPCRGVPVRAESRRGYPRRRCRQRRTRRRKRGDHIGIAAWAFDIVSADTVVIAHSRAEAGDVVQDNIADIPVAEAGDEGRKGAVRRDIEVIAGSPRGRVPVRPESRQAVAGCGRGHRIIRRSRYGRPGSAQGPS